MVIHLKVIEGGVREKRPPFFLATKEIESGRAVKSTEESTVPAIGG